MRAIFEVMAQEQSTPYTPRESDMEQIVRDEATKTTHDIIDGVSTVLQSVEGSLTKGNRVGGGVSEIMPDNAQLTHDQNFQFGLQPGEEQPPPPEISSEASPFVSSSDSHFSGAEPNGGFLELPQPTLGSARSGNGALSRDAGEEPSGQSAPLRERVDDVQSREQTSRDCLSEIRSEEEGKEEPVLVAPVFLSAPPRQLVRCRSLEEANHLEKGNARTGGQRSNSTDPPLSSPPSLPKELVRCRSLSGKKTATSPSSSSSSSSKRGSLSAISAGSPASSAPSTPQSSSSSSSSSRGASAGFKRASKKGTSSSRRASRVSSSSSRRRSSRASGSSDDLAELPLSHLSLEDQAVVAKVARKHKKRSLAPDSLLLKQAEDARRMVAESHRADAEAREKWAAAVRDAEEGGWDLPPPPDSLAMDGDLSFYDEEALKSRASLMQNPVLVEAVSKIWRELEHVSLEHGSHVATPDMIDQSSSANGHQTGNGGVRLLLEEAYCIFHRAMTKALVPGVKESELEGLAKEDWIADTQRLGRTVSLKSSDVKFMRASSRQSLKGVEEEGDNRGNEAEEKEEGAEEAEGSDLLVVVPCLDEEGFRRSVMEMADLWTTTVDPTEYMGFLEVVADVVAEEALKKVAPFEPTPPQPNIPVEAAPDEESLEDNDSLLEDLDDLSVYKPLNSLFGRLFGFVVDDSPPPEMACFAPAPVPPPPLTRQDFCLEEEATNLFPNDNELYPMTLPRKKHAQPKDHSLSYAEEEPLASLVGEKEAEAEEAGLALEAPLVIIPTQREALPAPPPVLDAVAPLLNKEPAPASPGSGTVQDPFPMVVVVRSRRSAESNAKPFGEGLDNESSADPAPQNPPSMRPLDTGNGGSRRRYAASVVTLAPKGKQLRLRRAARRRVDRGARRHLTPSFSGQSASSSLSSSSAHSSYSSSSAHSVSLSPSRAASFSSSPPSSSFATFSPTQRSTLPKVPSAPLSPAAGRGSRGLQRPAPFDKQQKGKVGLAEAASVRRASARTAQLTLPSLPSFASSPNQVFAQVPPNQSLEGSTLRWGAAAVEAPVEEAQASLLMSSCSGSFDSVGSSSKHARTAAAFRDDAALSRGGRERANQNTGRRRSPVPRGRGRRQGSSLPSLDSLSSASGGGTADSRRSGATFGRESRSKSLSRRRHQTISSSADGEGAVLTGGVFAAELHSLVRQHFFSPQAAGEPAQLAKAAPRLMLPPVS